MRKQNKKKLKSRRMVGFSGAKMAERYCANKCRILYPLTTENKLRVFIIKSFCFLLNMVLLKIKA
jgi:hypothetical protein